jgi:hypothetical protein
MSGSRSASARSVRRASFSPTTDPMLPPRNPKSNTPSATGRPSIVHRPLTKASL